MSINGSKTLKKYQSASYSSTAGTLPPPIPSHSGSQSAPESPSSTTSSSMSHIAATGSAQDRRTGGQPSPDPPHHPGEPSALAPHSGASYYASFDPAYSYAWPQQYGPHVVSPQYGMPTRFDSDSLPENSQVASVPAATYAPYDPNRPPPSYAPYHYGHPSSQP